MCVVTPVLDVPSTTTPATARSVFTVALAGFVAIGLPEGALGVAWPAIRDRFDQPVSGLGVVLAVYTAGYLSTSLAAGPVEGRVGRGALLVAAAGCGAVGLLATAAAPTWPVLLVAAVLVGGTGGVLDAVINAHVAVHHGVRRLGLLHAAYGIGATAAPLALAALLAAGGSWRLAYLALAAAELAVLAGFARTRRAWTTIRPQAPGPSAEVVGRGQRSFVTLSLLLFFLYVGLETTAGQWSFSLLTEQEGLDPGIAGLWAGSFFGALTLGRLLLASPASRWDESRVLDVSLVIVVAGCVLVWWRPVPAVAGAGLAVTGLGAAAVFPALIAITPRRLGPQAATRLIGVQIAASALGGAALPLLTGAIADRAGLSIVGVVLVLTAVTLLAVHRATERLAGH